MKIKLLTLFFLAGISTGIFAQLPQDVYKKSLKEVLSDIEERYKVKLSYSESLVRGVDVMYPTWRYRAEVEPTLVNILIPLDMVFQNTGENAYQVSRYLYYQRPVEDGKKHLDQLLALYPEVNAWDKRKEELRKCFLEQLQLSPLLVISDGNDWTQNVPVVEFPYLRKVYSLYGKEGNVENVHLANEGHDYGVSKRMVMYDFMARHLGLNINAVKDKTGRIDESKVTVEKYDAQLVFGKEGKLPSGAIKGEDKIREVLKSLQ